MTIKSFFQLLLLPLSWLYGVGVFVRNKQFDLGLRKQVAFEIPLIVVGNLSVGGTGKTPMTAYLLNRLLPVKKSGVLSRGYRRKSTGYMEVTEFTAVSETGDEPKLIKQKFPHAVVAVSESRALGIATMIHENQELELVILDDAFQHRQIVAGLSLLLTEYAHPFSRDRLLPAGRLREPVAGSKRADGIIVTKCPVTLTVEERNQLAIELATFHPQPVFFSYLKYGEPYHISDSAKKYLIKAGDEVLLFCGIANPKPLVSFLEQQSVIVHLFRFRDHHNYSTQDLNSIRSGYEKLKGKRSVMLTTEKDAVRLHAHKELIINEQLEIYCIPVEIVFFEEDGALFDEFIAAYVNSSVYIPQHALS